LFHVPAWGRDFAYLPMGWLRASDIASAASAAIADLPWRGSRRAPIAPTRQAASALVCADNCLIAGPTALAVSRRLAVVERRSSRVRAAFSHPFDPPSRRVTFYGVSWDL